MFKNKKMLLLGTALVPFVVPFTVLSCSGKTEKKLEISNEIFHSSDGVKWKNGKMILPPDLKLISNSNGDSFYSPTEGNGRSFWFETSTWIFNYNFNNNEIGTIIKSEFQNKNSLLSNKKASDIKREIEDNLLNVNDENAIFENYTNIRWFLDVFRIFNVNDVNEWRKKIVPDWLKKNLKVFFSDNANVAAYPVSPEINDPMDQSIWFEFEVFDEKTNTHYFAKSPKYSWWYLGEKQ